MDHPEEDEEEIEIDEEQIEDYCRMLDRLGTFPEKVAINSLSMAAEDFSSSPTSASKIYHCIRRRLLDRTTPVLSSPDRKLPLVYVIDSLVKNVKGVYVTIVQNDAAEWMKVVYDIFDGAGMEDAKGRLKKVWRTWKEFRVITDEGVWRKIGECFLKAEEREVRKKSEKEAKAKKAGIGKNPDGSLQIAPPLRKQMQQLLDEVQSTGVDELDKVSLERLADINPDLLLQIKQEAELVMQEQKQQQQRQNNLMQTTGHGGLGGISSSSTGPNSSSNIISSPNTSSTAPHQSDWSKLKLNHLEKSHNLIASLQKHVRTASQQTTVVVRSEVEDTVRLYAAVSASAQILTEMLHQWKVQGGVEGDGYRGYGGSGIGGVGGVGGGSRSRRYSLVRKEKFTTEGVKERNDAVIARLYEVGLPFVCSADGRRFATQIELSKHLDMLFKKSQLEKTMERTEERGWYNTESTWIGISSTGDTTSSSDGQKTGQKISDPLHPYSSASSSNPTDIPSSSTVVADESRDRCILCGINFDMFFDQEDGEWKYRNCTEKNVREDGATKEDAVLVHMNCWEGLGSPVYLTPDQILHSG